MKNKSKVYINRQPVVGPWGGGNKFVSLLSDYLLKKGHLVTYDLTDDVDIIFCFDPRPNSKGLWYQNFLDHRYMFNSKIIQRVGDVGTHSKPQLTKLVTQTVQYSDFVIFPSQWSKDYIKYEKDNCKVIHNAPLPIFYNNRRSQYSIGSSVKVVTHHWSTNEKKGFDYYEYLGKKIGESLNDVEFTYIGRYNDRYSHTGINVINPMDKEQLSVELPKHDIYLTASLEEAGANHVLEAMACGLPVLYRSNGGSISEYCSEYGKEYSTKDQMLKEISGYANTRTEGKYDRSADDVVRIYEKIICQV